MTRASFVCLLSGCAVLVSACSAADAPSNLLLISVDTLRPDHTGLYGYARDTTPNLDAFFAAGSVFESVWSTAPCTLPAVPQMLMGRFELEPPGPMLAEILRDRGYATGAVVSQHQFDPALHESPEHQQPALLVQRGFQHFDMQQASELSVFRMSTRTARAVTRGGLAWLSDRAGSEPFFLWLHYFDPHDPYEPPGAYREFDRGNGSERSGDRRRHLQLERRTPEEPWQSAGYVFDAVDVAHFVNLYDGEIRFTDAEIGKVLGALEASGLVEETLVVFVSDHGELLGEDERWDHCLSLGEPEVRVPMLIRDRGGPVGGSHRIAVPASTIDLVPTVLGLLGLAPPAEGLDGIDLREGSERPVFAAWRGHAAVRSGDWKLVDAEARRLYDLGSGAGEQADRWAEEGERGAALAADLERFRRSNPVLTEQNEEILEQLRGIGYVE